VSFQFEPFKDQWLTFTDILDPFAECITYSVNLDVDFFTSLKLDSNNTLQYRINAAKASAAQLGTNPVLCLSGGVDSQAMIQCWQEAGLKFDVAIMEFENNLNQHDVSVALAYCNAHGIEPIILKLNVIQFLTRDCIEFGTVYKCASPHFITHYQMFDMLRDLGYTGICCGGTAFARNHAEWGPVPSAAQSNYIEYSNRNNFPVIGNFLGYDPALCWSMALLTPEHDVEWVTQQPRVVSETNAVRYAAKILGYRNHGFDIIPQENKYTGFELIKDYFAEKFNDGWAFEKMFRIPLQKKFGTAFGVLTLSEQQVSAIDKLYYEGFGSGGLSAPWISM
jgi:hypothetical protein